MQIHYSLTSPYARKVRIFAALVKEPEIQWILTKPLETPDFRRVNPLGKIPALVSDSITLFDSALICEYLDDRYCARGGVSLFHRGQADYFTVQKNHYLANGIMDAAVAAVMDKRRPDAPASAFWLNRWHESIQAGIRALSASNLGAPDAMNIGGVATVCALGYLGFRHAEIDIARLNPTLAEWYAAIARQVWFSETQPQDQ